jgi:hypothetical protein
MRTDTRPTLLTWVYGIALALLLGIAGIGMDGPSAQEEAEATELALQDALKQAQADNPAGWTAEQRARGDIAAHIAAQHRWRQQ